MTTRQLQLRIDARTSGAVSAVGQLQSRLGALDRQAMQITRSTGRMSGALESAAGFFIGGGALALAGRALSGLASGFSALGKSAITANFGLEQTTIAFETMLGSGEKARSFLEDLRGFAKRTPFEFEGLVDSSRKLLAFGFASERVIPLMTSLGDVASGLAVGSEGIDRMTRALGQMKAKGRVQTEELMQLQEMGINTGQIFEAMGVAPQQARALVESGRLSAEQFIEGFQKYAAARFPNMMNRQSKTALGAWSNIMDTAKQALQRIGAPISRLLASGINRLASVFEHPMFEEWLKTLESAAEGVAKVLGDLGNEALKWLTGPEGSAAIAEWGRELKLLGRDMKEFASSDEFKTLLAGMKQMVPILLRMAAGGVRFMMTMGRFVRVFLLGHIKTGVKLWKFLEGAVRKTRVAVQAFVKWIEDKFAKPWKAFRDLIAGAKGDTLAFAGAVDAARTAWEALVGAPTAGGGGGSGFGVDSSGVRAFGEETDKSMSLFDRLKVAVGGFHIWLGSAVFTFASEYSGKAWDWFTSMPILPAVTGLHSWLLGNTFDFVGRSMGAIWAWLDSDGAGLKSTVSGISRWLLTNVLLFPASLSIALWRMLNWDGAEGIKSKVEAASGWLMSNALQFPAQWGIALWRMFNWDGAEGIKAKIEAAAGWLLGYPLLFLAQWGVLFTRMYHWDGPEGIKAKIEGAARWLLGNALLFPAQWGIALWRMFNWDGSDGLKGKVEGLIAWLAGKPIEFLASWSKFFDWIVDGTLRQKWAEFIGSLGNSGGPSAGGGGGSGFGGGGNGGITPANAKLLQEYTRSTLAGLYGGTPGTVVKNSLISLANWASGLGAPGFAASLSGIGNQISAAAVLNDQIQAIMNAVREAYGGVGGLPQLAGGGIVTRPTLAWVGERGPEAVIPLPASGAAPSVVINNYGNVYANDLRDQVVSAIEDLQRTGRLRLAGA